MMNDMIKLKIMGCLISLWFSRKIYEIRDLSIGIMHTKFYFLKQGTIYFLFYVFFFPMIDSFHYPKEEINKFLNAEDSVSIIR